MKEVRVIDIMNDRQIIIDYGSEDGAKPKQKLKVLEIGPIILDLQGKNIGTLDSIKDVLYISKVYEKFSICQKENNDNNFFTSLLIPLSEINVSSTTQSKGEIPKIYVEPNDVSNINLPEITPIKKGDIVKILDI